MIKFEILHSADKAPWTEKVSATDHLPIRPSGGWIEKKHRLLMYYGKLFSIGMKNLWKERVYCELFSGPGRCFVRDTSVEDLGSPLKVIDSPFTRFIFVERNLAAARALEERLSPFPNADRAEIWCGDCAEALTKIKFPTDNTLTFAFIDPTGIAHAPSL